ncbi:Tetratricopeptide-like helical domain superfamily [Sesbania bispinosa]|nr:Tetratricopeptide-like helical domain superfamily [Sesbania bispinosa]
MSFLRLSLLSNPTFLLSFPSILRALLHSHSLPTSVPNAADESVSSFIRTLRVVPTPSTLEFNKILGSLVKLKRYPTAISLSHQMEFSGIAPDLVALITLLNCFCQLYQINFSFSVLGKIFKRGYQPDTITLTTLMRGLCLNGEVKRALHFHDHVLALGFQLDQVSYGTLINGLCKVGETRVALQLLRQLEGQSVQPDVGESLVLGSLLMRCMIEAFALFKKIKDMGIQPDMYTYSVLIDGLCKGGRLKNAQDRAWLKKHWPCYKKWRTMVAFLITCEIIIRALFEKDENDKAEKLLREMTARGFL